MVTSTGRWKPECLHNTSSIFIYSIQLVASILLPKKKVIVAVFVLKLNKHFLPGFYLGFSSMMVFLDEIGLGLNLNKSKTFNFKDILSTAADKK